MASDGPGERAGARPLARAFALVAWGAPAGCGPRDEAAFVPPVASPPADAPLAALVDPFVGTANDGQTFPGPSLPWGLAARFSNMRPLRRAASSCSP
ncbi:MAG: hypothetical protein HY908_23515 [Myxococcales bacterium]|nr:hypothetical protein [Myxococcales bacterium]